MLIPARRQRAYPKLTLLLQENIFCSQPFMPIVRDGDLRYLAQHLGEYHERIHDLLEAEDKPAWGRVLLTTFWVRK